MSIRETLIRVTKQAYHEKLFAATSGNLSIYDRENDRMYITPGSYPYEIMTEEDVMVIDLDGNVIEGKHRPSSEWRMHAAVYRADPSVNAIVHTHSPHATAFAINRMPIPVVLYEMVFFLNGDIPVAAPAAPGLAQVGENCVAALKDRYGCLMANHGALAVASDLDMAYTRAVYIEDAAKAYSIALTHGSVCIVPESEVEAIRRR